MEYWPHNASYVSPTCVGMNRLAHACARACARKPHVRGDEPFSYDPDTDPIYVSPTCVGMNRNTQGKKYAPASKPHVRGDEPRRQG